MITKKLRIQASHARLSCHKQSSLFEMTSFENWSRRAQCHFMLFLARKIAKQQVKQALSVYEGKTTT